MRSTSTMAIRLIDGLAALSTAVAAVALAGLVVVQGWQVCARYLLNDTPSWTEPVTLTLLSTAMALGAAAGVHAERHFAFTLLADRAPDRLRRAATAVVTLGIVAIGTTLVSQAAELLAMGWDVPTAGAPLPESLPYLPVVVGGALMVLFALARPWRAAREEHAA